MISVKLGKHADDKLKLSSPTIELINNSEGVKLV